MPEDETDPVSTSNVIESNDVGMEVRASHAALDQDHASLGALSTEPKSHLAPETAVKGDASSGALPVEPKSDLTPDANIPNTVETQGDVTEPAKGADADLEAVVPDGGTAEDDVPGDTGGPEDIGTAAGKKKKKKKKPKSQRGLQLKNAPTGFEEFYVDAPLTPAEYEIEKDMYDSSLPFLQRIETAIQRFFAKRNLNSLRRNFFDKYLVHGGIAGGPKMFTGGLDAETIDNSNAQELAALTATHYVDYRKLAPEHGMYVVDFEACLKAFFSSRVPVLFELDTESKIKDFTGIIRNFLNYLLHHDVCSEYLSQINASRTLCDLAASELCKLSQLEPLLPGTFNKACSELFGGMYRGDHRDVSNWPTADKIPDLDGARYTTGLTTADAQQVFKIAFVAHASEPMIKNFRLESQDDHNYTILSREDTGLEVTNIMFSHLDPEVTSLYAHPEAKGVKPVGKLLARTWTNPTTPAEDLTEEEEAALASSPPEPRTYEFLLEDEALAHCFVGMKFEATVTTTGFGVSYFDGVQGVHASFFDILPNGMMDGWREVEEVWLPMRESMGGVGYGYGGEGDGFGEGEEGEG